MIIEQDIKLDFKDVLIRPMRSTLNSRKDVSLERDFAFKNSNHRYVGVPLIAANMDTIGTLAMAEALNEFDVIAALHKHIPVEELVQFFADNLYDSHFYSIGTNPKDLEKLEQVQAKVRELVNIPWSIPYVCIDVANGYSEHFSRFVRDFKQKYPDTTVMAGNVVTAEMTEQLILDGADIVKVGIGPGSVCTTRKQTGVGYPQLSAIIECANAAHGLGGLICADGGCTVPGDVAKAFGAGADFVMLGGMFAGHDQCGGEMIGGDAKLKNISNLPTFSPPSIQKGFTLQYDGDKELTITEDVIRTLDTLFAIQQDEEIYPVMFPLVQKYLELFDIDYTNAKMEFYGMSSKTAMDKHNGGVAEYRSSEGKTVSVPYRGDVRDTIQDILGGLRSACTYVGAKKLKEMSKRTTFIRVTQQINSIFS